MIIVQQMALKAAKQAHKDAAAILGTLFYDGKGGQDFEKALTGSLKLLNKATQIIIS